MPVRINIAGSSSPRALGDRTSAGVAALYAHDGGWRASSGFDEGKLNATLATSVRDAPLRVDFAGTVLDQRLHHRPRRVPRRGI